MSIIDDLRVNHDGSVSVVSAENCLNSAWAYFNRQENSFRSTLAKRVIRERIGPVEDPRDNREHDRVEVQNEIQNFLGHVNGAEFSGGALLAQTCHRYVLDFVSFFPQHAIQHKSKFSAAMAGVPSKKAIEMIIYITLRKGVMDNVVRTPESRNIGIILAMYILKAISSCDYYMNDESAFIASKFCQKFQYNFTGSSRDVNIRYKNHVGGIMKAVAILRFCRLFTHVKYW